MEKNNEVPRVKESEGLTHGKVEEGVYPEELVRVDVEALRDGARLPLVQQLAAQIIRADDALKEIGADHELGWHIEEASLTHGDGGFCCPTCEKARAARLRT